MFEKPDIPGLSEKAALELEVQVLNINEGRNEAIARRCKKLAEYSAFIAKTRTFEEGREEVARNALAQGIPPELIHAITGLDIESIHGFQPRL